MDIDGNSIEMKALELAYEGKTAECQALQRQWIDEFVAEGKDHCPCPEPCPHHGNCFECVLIHRGHRDHLPYCFWDMVNERLDRVARLTEGSYKRYESSCTAPCFGCSEKKRSCQE